jgi:hypothetical protein
MSNKISRDKWVYTRLTSIEHNALLNRATERGQSAVDLAADLIREGLLSTDEDDNSIEMRIFRAHHEARGRELLRLQLETIASNADGDEDKMDELEKLCTDAQFTLEEIMEGATRLSGLGLSSLSNSKVDKAKLFIANMLRNGAVPAREAMDTAIEAGFGRSTVNQAKRELEVQSIREGNSRLWELPSVSRIDRVGMSD